MSEVFLFVRGCLFGVVEVVEQSLIRSVIGCRDKYISQELFFVFRVAIESAQSIDKGINSFVAKLVTTADSNDFGIFINRLSYQSLCHIDEAFSGCFAFLIEIFFSRDNSIVEAIRGDDISFSTKEVLCFLSCNFAYSSEAIGNFSSFFFEEVLVLYPKTICHFFGVVVFHFVVKRIAITRYRTPYDCGVSSENRAYFRHFAF